jgi:hypothetical protein
MAGAGIKREVTSLQLVGILIHMAGAWVTVCLAPGLVVSVHRGLFQVQT